jgi:hypothetical protein
LTVYTIGETRYNGDIVKLIKEIQSHTGIEGEGDGVGVMVTVLATGVVSAWCQT